MDQYEWKDYVDSGPNHRKVVMRTRERKRQRARARKWGRVSLEDRGYLLIFYFIFDLLGLVNFP